MSAVGRRLFGALLLALPAGLSGQVETGGAPLPPGHLFQPLLADPKQPHFFAAWLSVHSNPLTTNVGSVGLGEVIGLVRDRGGRWQASISAGVFSQFDMRTTSNDLINTDFVIGFPVSHRAGAFSFRGGIYHQSSHLGDEFILNGTPARVNLSFEAIEVLLSRDFGPIRAYGGGEYLVRHEPEDLKPGVLHGGVEYRHPRPLFQLRTLGDATFIAALDVKSTQEVDWKSGWSGRLGIELRPAGANGRRLRFQLQGYTGPTPYGQFYEENLTSIGLGAHFEL